MPDTLTRTYAEWMSEARRLYQQVVLPDLTAAMYAEYAEMLIDVLADLEEGTITAERAEELAAAIEDRMREMAERMGSSGDSAAVDAMELAVEAHVQAVREVGERAGLGVRVSFAEVPERALLLMNQRRGYAGTFRTLINRHVQDLAPEVEKHLRSSVARGASARRAGQGLARILAGNDPALLETLRAMGPRGGRTRKAIREGVEIDPERARQAKSLLSDTYRIAVHETNTAFIEADIQAAIESPVVDLLRYRLSRTHVIRDVCDVMAEHDAHGYGPGLYHKEAAPGLQHPFCRCYHEKVLRPPSEWDRPPRPLPGVRVPLDVETRAILAGAPGARLTPRFVERQGRLAAESLRRARGAVIREDLPAMLSRTGGGGGFTPAESTREAERWAVENRIAKSVSYEGVDLSIANAVNQTYAGQRAHFRPGFFPRLEAVRYEQDPENLMRGNNRVFMIGEADPEVYLAHWDAVQEEDFTLSGGRVVRSFYSAIGRLPREDAVRSVALHEAAHAVHYSLDRLRLTMWNGAVEATSEEDLVTRVSHYANYRYPYEAGRGNEEVKNLEAFSEAYVLYYGGLGSTLPDPIRAFFDQLERRFKRP